MGGTQILLMWSMWEELEGPMTTLFGSSGAAMIVLAGYFWIQEKRNEALSEMQGYNKHERTEVVRNSSGELKEQPLIGKDNSGIIVTFVWFAVCWVLTSFLF